MKDLRFDRTVLTKGGLKLRTVVYFDENGETHHHRTNYAQGYFNENVDRVT